MVAAESEVCPDYLIIWSSSGYLVMMRVSVWWWWVVGAMSCLSLAQLNPDIVPLEHLYESTGGADWYWRSGEMWNFTRDGSGEYVHDPCSTGGASWEGVTCSADPADCTLHPCQFFGTNFRTGTVPAELGMLSMLQILDLKSNELMSQVK